LKHSDYLIYILLIIFIYYIKKDLDAGNIYWFYLETAMVIYAIFLIVANFLNLSEEFFFTKRFFPKRPAYHLV
jgi:hypothetical protein